MRSTLKLAENCGLSLYEMGGLVFYSGPDSLIQEFRALLPSNKQLHPDLYAARLAIFRSGAYRL